MKLVEVIQPTPEVIRLFEEPNLGSGNFVTSLLNCLGHEKATHFTGVNAYLESSLGDSNYTLETMSSFQSHLELLKSDVAHRELEKGYSELKSKAQGCLQDLHRSKIKLNDLKITLCRFIINYESPAKNTSRPYHLVEEWMDAATLAEMRLSKAMQGSVNNNLHQLLALFMTFRSIVCSYDGPSTYIRQIENSIASLEVLYEKVHLEMEVLNANRTLVQTRRELSTAKHDLSSLQHNLEEKNRREAQLARLMSLSEKSSLPQIVIIGFCLMIVSVVLAVYLNVHLKPVSGAEVDGISQRSCLEIEKQLEKSPRYQSQVLIFRKFGQDIYFRANAMTCEKLHRLDSTQIYSLGGLLKVDYSAGNQNSAAYNGNRVMQVKDVGINKLVLKLSNHTENNLDYKVKVLEKANSLRAILEPDVQGLSEDLLIVDLSHK